MTTTSQIEAAGWLPLNAGPGACAACSCLKPTPDMITLPETKLITVKQIHSERMIVTTGNEADCAAEADAVITMQRGLAVGVRTADCVPIVINAPTIGGIAAVHAGWRGTMAGIVAAVTEHFVNTGASPDDIYAAIGPHICASCYEVSPELADDFAKVGYGKFILTEGFARPHLDLGGINHRQLLDCGLTEAHISTSLFCTLCTPGEKFPSYRRDATSNRLYTIIYRP